MVDRFEIEIEVKSSEIKRIVEASGFLEDYVHEDDIEVLDYLPDDPWPIVEHYGQGEIMKNLGIREMVEHLEETGPNEALMIISQVFGTTEILQHLEFRDVAAFVDNTRDEERSRG